MRSLRKLITVALGATVLSCGGGTGENEPPVTFAFRLHGLPASEEFRLRMSSATFIAQAREQLRLPESQRRLFPAGPIAAGTGGYNLDWSWHFTEATLTESSIELCDARPGKVEASLPYWLGTFKSFCTWSGYVHAELQKLQARRSNAQAARPVAELYTSESSGPQHR